MSNLELENELWAGIFSWDERFHTWDFLGPLTSAISDPSGPPGNYSFLGRVWSSVSRLRTSRI